MLVCPECWPVTYASAIHFLNLEEVHLDGANNARAWAMLKGSGRSQVVVMVTNLPVSPDFNIEVITSTACNASSKEQRCGRSERMDKAISDNPDTR